MSDVREGVRRPPFDFHPDAPDEGDAHLKEAGELEQSDWLIIDEARRASDAILRAGGIKPPPPHTLRSYYGATN